MTRTRSSNLDTDPNTASPNGGRARRPRRRIPLRIRVVIAGVLGLLIAWLIPKGGGKPADVTMPTPTPAHGVTAVEERLADVSPGVSFRVIDGVRLFLVRTGDTVVGFRGNVTRPDAGPLQWCIGGQFFMGSGGPPFYDRAGHVSYNSAPRDLDRITVIVAAGRVTIVPHEIVPGASNPTFASQNEGKPAPRCAANDRLG